MIFDEEHSLNNPEINDAFYRMIIDNFYDDPCDEETARRIESMLDSHLKTAHDNKHPYHINGKEVLSFVVDFNEEGIIGLTPCFEVLDIEFPYLDEIKDEDDSTS